MSEREDVLAMVVHQLDLGIDTAASLWMDGCDGSSEKWDQAYVWARSRTSAEKDENDLLQEANDRLRARVAELEGQVQRVRAVLDKADEDNANSFRRMYGGGLFPTNIGVTEVRAALDGSGPTP